MTREELCAALYVQTKSLEATRIAFKQHADLMHNFLARR